MERSPFKRCPVCNSKYPHIDVHPVCNKCLSPDHDEANCMACSRFRSKKTIRLRRVARQEAQHSAPDPVNIFDTEGDDADEQEGQETFSNDDADVESNYDADAEMFEAEDCVGEVGDDDGAYGATEDSSGEELCPVTTLPKAQVEGSPQGLTQDLQPSSIVSPSGPTTDISTEPTLQKSKPKVKALGSMAASTEPPLPISKPKEKSSESKKHKIESTSKQKASVASSASTSKVVSVQSKTKKAVESTKNTKLASAAPKALSKASEPALSSTAVKAQEKLDAPKHVDPKHRPDKATTTTLESTGSSGSSATIPSSTPSASMEKRVSDSLQRIKVKASTVDPKVAQTSTPLSKAPKSAAPIQFTLPPKVAPKAFTTKKVVEKSVAASVDPTAVSTIISVTPRRPIIEEQSEQFIDAYTGKLSIYKRKISPALPMESYHIPLKKKKDSSSSPVLVELINPSAPVNTPMSPTHSEVGAGDDDDEQYNYPVDTDPDDQQDDWIDTADPGDPQIIADSQLYAAKTSPTEDSAAFNALIERAAKNHDVQLHADPVEVDFLFDTFSASEKTVKTLPMLKGVLKHATDIFKDPTRARVINPRIEKKYKPAPGDPTYIKGQLPLDSLVVSNARKRANSQATGDAPPPDKESKVLEASGKRVAAQAANIWRISNTQALLARYDRAHYDTLETLLQHLPDEYKEGAEMLIQEGKLISNASIKCALDVADTAARAINTSVMLRRQAWLRISGFKPEIQTTILNQPVNPDHLFGPEVDSTLEKIKKDTETAKSMGALQSQQFRGSTFRRSSNRGVSRGHMSQQTQYSKGTAQTSYNKQSRGGYRGNSTKGRGRGNNNSRASTTTKQ